MRYRDLAKEMTYEEVQVAFRILEPEGILLGWHRDEGFVRIQYRRPYSETVRRMDLLPDTVYTGTGHESQDEPWPEGDAMHRYHQFMVAKGYSQLWKDNPFAERDPSVVSVRDILDYCQTATENAAKLAETALGSVGKGEMCVSACGGSGILPESGGDLSIPYPECTESSCREWVESEGRGGVSMTEQKAAEYLRACVEQVECVIGYSRVFRPEADLSGLCEERDALLTAISALEEVQSNREAGAV